MRRFYKWLVGVIILAIVASVAITFVNRKPTPALDLGAAICDKYNKSGNGDHAREIWANGLLIIQEKFQGEYKETYIPDLYKTRQEFLDANISDKKYYGEDNIRCRVITSD